MKAPTKLRAGIIGFALSFYLLLQFLSQYPEFVEQYYSNGLYPILTLVVSGISSRFAVSLSELAAWGIVFLGIPFVLYRIKSKRMSALRVVLNLLVTVAFVYIWFYLFWGLNYLRQPLKTKLNLEEQQLPINAFDSTLVHIIDKGNDLNPTYSIKQMAEIDSIIDVSFQQVLSNLGLPKVSGYRGFKTFTVNWVLNKTTTSGWFSPFLHEIHYNSDLLVFEMPFVIAHEKAHQMGYASEAEANFLAYLVCLNAEDPLCKYSGYFQMLGYFLAIARGKEETSQDYTEELSQGVQLDIAAVRQRWKSHRGIVSRITSQFYDLYLKANNVPEGVQNYSKVVDLVIRFNEAQEE